MCLPDLCWKAGKNLREDTVTVPVVKIACQHSQGDIFHVLVSVHEVDLANQLPDLQLAVTAQATLIANSLIPSYIGFSYDVARTCEIPTSGISTVYVMLVCVIFLHVPLSLEN